MAAEGGGGRKVEGTDEPRRRWGGPWWAATAEGCRGLRRRATAEIRGGGGLWRVAAGCGRATAVGSRGRRQRRAVKGGGGLQSACGGGWRRWAAEGFRRRVAAEGDGRGRMRAAEGLRRRVTAEGGSERWRAAEGCRGQGRRARAEGCGIKSDVIT